MKVLRLMRKWWCKLWRCGEDLRIPIDSHQWTTKIEIYRSLSSKRS